MSPDAEMSPDHTTPTDVGEHDMQEMGLAGHDLPSWLTWTWVLILLGACAVQGRSALLEHGQRRWFHASHLLTTIGMAYMYASVALHTEVIPPRLWRWVFIVTSVAMAVWLVSRYVQRRPVSYVWLLALTMQAAMAYMWLPTWQPFLTWMLVAYFAAEAVAWPTGWIDDHLPEAAIFPGERDDYVSLADGGFFDALVMGAMSASMACMYGTMQLTM